MSEPVKVDLIVQQIRQAAAEMLHEDPQSDWAKMFISIEVATDESPIRLSERRAIGEQISQGKTSGTMHEGSVSEFRWATTGEVKATDE
jgi:hypothetical protein